MAADQRGRWGRVPVWGRLPSEVQIWLALGFASLTAIALGTATTLAAFARMFAESCGEDQRWPVLCLATGLAGMAAVSGLVPAVGTLRADSSLRPPHRHPHRATAIVAAAAVSLSIAGASTLLPTGACG